MKILTAALGGILAVLLAVSAQGAALTYSDLVSRLVDLEGLARLPIPGEVTAQFSSYDRASAYDSATGKYVGWAANGDNNGIMGREGAAIVMADIKGPGCIWRIWSALANEGHVKIFLDGASRPAVDLPFRAYFSGDTPPFVYPALVNHVSQGRNCYVPIPFQKSCKVIADEGWGAYYHFTYSRFPEGTSVPTFSSDVPTKDQLALSRVNGMLTRGLGSDPAASRPGLNSRTTSVTAQPGTQTSVLRLRGPRAITSIRVRMRLAPGQSAEDALRQTTLSIRWDGESSPSVWAPLGDFFGTGPGVNQYKSLPLGMTSEGFYCFFYMPFEKNADISLTNDSNSPVKMDLTVSDAPVTGDIRKLGRFHAKWHRDAFLPDDPERRAIDWTMLTTRGRGRFCGVMLEVWNPKGAWWGEGDEKFLVDGEKFPSTFGTGSEDYFGYAWCDPALFQNAFHNQTRNDGNNKGHVSVNRWHIADSVPFQKSFEGDIEKYYPNNRPTLYACTAYWYLESGGEDPYLPLSVKERTDWYPVPARKVVKGVVEGETMKVLEKTGGNVDSQEMGGFGEHWSGGEQLWWTGAKPQDKLTLNLPVPSSGRYKVSASLTKAPDYGIVQFSLDGELLGASVDLYHETVTLPAPVVLGERQLASGPHRLTLQLLGANDKAIKGFMAGLDCVRLEPVR